MQTAIEHKRHSPHDQGKKKGNDDRICPNDEFWAAETKRNKKTLYIYDRWKPKISCKCTEIQIDFSSIEFWLMPWRSLAWSGLHQKLAGAAILPWTFCLYSLFSVLMSKWHKLFWKKKKKQWQKHAMHWMERHHVELIK